jgi:hypothetical protein
VIDDRQFLAQFGYSGGTAKVHDLWRHLIETAVAEFSPWRGPLTAILEQGPLASRILRATGKDPSPDRLAAVYRELCTCLAEGKLFPIS